MLRVCQDLSENDLGRDASSSLALDDALRVNTSLRSLLLSRTSYMVINRRIVEISDGRLYTRLRES